MNSPTRNDDINLFSASGASPMLEPVRALIVVVLTRGDGCMGGTARGGAESGSRQAVDRVEFAVRRARRPLGHRPLSVVASMIAGESVPPTPSPEEPPLAPYDPPAPPPEALRRGVQPGR